METKFDQLKFFLDKRSCQVISDPIEYFVNVVSAQLLKENKYYQDSDAARDDLIATMDQIAEKDPEFIAQTAYYVRNKMYIRTTTNFILAYAIMHPKVKAFVPKYFNKSVLIPGDLIEVCTFVQVVNLVRKGISIESVKEIRKQLIFPNNLKKLVAAKLKQFSIYQLGKQCSEASRKRTLIKYQKYSNPQLAAEKKAKRRAKLIALKKVIDSQGGDVKQQFNAFLKERTGKRLKHSKSHKHKQKTQQTAIKKNVFDIQFLSLKDIIKFCHVSEPKELVMSVLGKKYPKDEEQFKQTFVANDQTQFIPERAGKRMQIPIPITWDRVLSSKDTSQKDAWTSLLQNNQVPYLAMIRNLKNILEAQLDPILYREKVCNVIFDEKRIQKAKIFPLQFMTALSQIQTAAQSQIMIQATRKCLIMALQTSVDKNLEAITGVTYIFVDVSGSMRAQISGGKSYGSVQTCQDCAFTLGLMIQSKCQKSQFYLFAAPGAFTKGKCYVKMNFKSGSDFFDRFQKCQSEAQKLCGSQEQVGQTIKDVLLVPKIKADNVIILSDMIVTQGFDENGERFQRVIKTYLKDVNKDTKFFFMDISGYGQQINFGDDLKGKNCFKITGMSDHVLRFIALNGQVDQVSDIRNFASSLNDQKVNSSDIHEKQVKEILQSEEERKNFE